MTPLSLRARLTLWYVLVLVAVLTLFATVVVVTQRRIGIARIDRELEATDAQLVNMLGEELRELDTPRLAAEESRDVIASGGRALAVLDQHGTVLAEKLDGVSLTELMPDGLAAGLSTVETARGSWRVLLRRDTVNAVPLTHIVASPLLDLARDQREMRQAIMLGLPLALLLAAAGGLWLASVGLRPITHMARRAVSLPLSGDDDLGPAARADEIGQLTGAFNGVVARLRSALRTQRQFMADASHELRSPVAVIRTAADVALSRDHRDEAEYREALAITATQSARLGRLVDDMLVLARADAGGYPLQIVDLYLDEVVEEARRDVAQLAADRQVALSVSGASDIAIRGDHELLRRLVVNLLQNAVQHSPPAGSVRVVSDTKTGGASIRVHDTGPGIPDADRSRIFDRFVQLDPSRRSQGAGLGLTIARWIATAHGGALTLELTGPQGSTFCLTLPSGRSSAA